MPICQRCNGDHDEPSSKQTLATQLCYWRAMRPDEWIMDEFMREAIALQKCKALLNDLWCRLETVEIHELTGDRVYEGTVEADIAEAIEDSLAI